jgi:hypothetical protein
MPKQVDKFSITKAATLRDALGALTAMTSRGICAPSLLVLGPCNGTRFTTRLAFGNRAIALHRCGSHVGQPHDARTIAMTNAEGLTL